MHGTATDGGPEGDLRGLLLPTQPAVRPGARRTLRDLPPRPARGAAPARPAALRLPHRAPRAGHVVVSLPPGAGRPARLRAALARRRDGSPTVGAGPQ